MSSSVMHLFVRTTDHALLELQAAGTTTIADLKALVHSHLPRMRPRRQHLVFGSILLAEDGRTLADYGVVNEATLQLTMRLDPKRAGAIETNMPIMSVVAVGAGLPVDFLDELHELGFDNDVAIPLLTRSDVVAAGTTAAAAVRFLSRCLLLHALKFTDKARQLEHWRAVVASGITERELKNATGYDFKHVLDSMTRSVHGEPCDPTMACLSADQMLTNIHRFSLKELRNAGATLEMLMVLPRLSSHRVDPDRVRARNFKYMTDFTAAGYSEAEVLAASRKCNRPLFAKGADGRDIKL